jgi:hypothetical protein
MFGEEAQAEGSIFHPEIRRFWEDESHDPVRTNRQGDRSPDYYTWYVRVEKDVFGLIIAHEWKDGSRCEYFFNDVSYTEEQMLRIIRLKAFL